MAQPMKKKIDLCSEYKISESLAKDFKKKLGISNDADLFFLTGKDASSHVRGYYSVTTTKKNFVCVNLETYLNEFKQMKMFKQRKSYFQGDYWRERLEQFGRTTTGRQDDRL